jgi:MGT family glycosyltransferase
VTGDGFTHVELVLGPGSNSGVMRIEDQSVEERKQLEEFFEATRRGMVPALRHQAEGRRRDLLHEPGRVARDIAGILNRHRPDVIVVDQLAFGATAALRGLGTEFVSFHPGHPSAIPTGHPYGFPAKIPIRIKYEPEELLELRDLCEDIRERFTAEYNNAMREIDPGVDPVTDAFSATSPSGTLVNYPAALGAGYGLPLSARFIGSSVRQTLLTPDLEAAFSEQKSRPRIYVSLGSFFSARSDILRKIVTAFQREPVELVIASGVTPRSELGRIPAHWTVAEHLPQPTVIAHSSLVITHGGNNTVTEALTGGVPLLVAPLSTDQFTAAADIEQLGLGRAFDPNFDSADTITDLADEVLTRSSGLAAALGHRLRRRPGQTLAADLLEAVLAGSSLFRSRTDDVA